MARALKALKAELHGLEQITISLKEAAQKIDREVNRRALRKAVRPMVREAKSNARASDDTGTLRRSIGAKVKTDKRRKAVTIFAGPRTGMARTGSDGRKRDPVRYAHLVELGRKSRAPYSGTHFLEKAFKAKRAEAFDIWAQTIELDLPKVIASVARRQTRRRRRR